MNKKKTIAIIAILLIVALLVGGIIAYFTDTDTATNVFTIGNVDIELLEDGGWTESTSSAGIYTNPSAVNLAPGAVVDKLPYISNVSSSGNSAYVFAKVTIPVYDVDGNDSTAEEELFTCNWNTRDWTRIAATTTTASTGVPATHVYVYAYTPAGTFNPLTTSSTTASKRGEDNSTSAIFTTATLNSNLTSDGIENIISSDIKVEAYGIQSDNLGSANTAAAVWGLFQTGITATAGN